MKTLLVTRLPDLTPWEEDEDAARRLANLYDRIARSVMKNCLGRQVGHDEGGYLMLFERPDHAITFAVAYFRALEKLSQGDEGEMIAGVGIHHGIQGSQGCEIARKLAAVAGQGRILLTQDAFALARPLLEECHRIRWCAHEACEVDGLAKPLEVFEARLEPKGPAVPSHIESEVERILHETLELPPDQREGYLARACGDNSAVRRDIASLIQADEQAGRFLVRSILAGSKESSTILSGISSLSQALLLNRLLNEPGLTKPVRQKDSVVRERTLSDRKS